MLATWIALLLVLLPVCGVRAQTPGSLPAAPTAAEPVLSPEDKADAEIGKSAAAELEKQLGDKVVKESPDVPRILAIIERLRPVTEKPRQEYQVKVLALPQINAFSLPGGYLYYTQGLLEAVESDDELAAVTAHEMAHVCLNHARRLMNKEKRYTEILAPVILASILANSDRVDAGKIAAVGSLVVQDALNHYGREAELEADLAAVRYLHQSGRYHPVAVLTVAEGLARLEASGPRVDAGVFQTHPEPEARVQAVLAELERLGIPVERRRVIKTIAASAVPIEKDGVEIAELRVGEHVIAQPAAEWEGASPLARAQRSAEALNALLLADLQLMEVGVVRAGDTISLVARGQNLLTATPADAAFHHTTVEALAQQALEGLRAAFHEERLRRYY